MDVEFGLDNWPGADMVSEVHYRDEVSLVIGPLKGG